MRILIAALLLAMAGPSLAAEIVATDGATIRLDRTIYRLDGIDAPEIDQMCLDEHDEVWACGVAVRDRLSAYIGSHAVRCDDKGHDPIYKHRRLGICTIEGEATTLNEWLVREGWAIKLGADAKGPFCGRASRRPREPARIVEGMFRRPARHAGMGSKRRAADRRRLPGRSSEPNPRKAVPRRLPDAAGMPDQGQAGAAGDRLRWHLSPAELRELSTREAGSAMVLLRGRCSGGGISQGADLPMKVLRPRSKRELLTQAMTVNESRHCERSEAIQFLTSRQDGLLRATLLQ